MLELRDYDIEFIKKNVDDADSLLAIDDKREFLFKFDIWLTSEKAMDDNYDYTDLGREGQRIYDYILDNC